VVGHIALMEFGMGRKARSLGPEDEGNFA